MQDNPQQVTIHLARLGKPERSYPEGLVDDNGRRVKTFSIVPEPASAHLSETFQGQGWILPGQRIHSVSKVLFYNEFFSIVDYHDPAGRTLGYYCDIVTPLRRSGADYFLTDLILDLWISPDGHATELDREEFEAALASGLFPRQFERDALHTLARLKTEVEQGIFPSRYLA